jgi:hypothetical protein
MSYTRKMNDKFIMRVQDIVHSDGKNVPRQPSVNLKKFQDALRKKMRGVQFSTSLMGSCWVYYPHETFARGRLIDRLEPNGGSTFAVNSRTITNERYADYSTEHYMQWSKNLNTAVKKAAAALVEWSALEMATIHARVYDKNRSDLIYASSQKRTKALDDLGVTGHSPAFATLQSMLHQITDLDVKSKVEEVLRHEKENAELESVGASPTFVHVCQDYRGRQILEAQKIDRIYYSAVDAAQVPKRYVEGTQDDEYGDLIGKVSVLNMAAVGDYVTGVGMKADEDMFYVS